MKATAIKKETKLFTSRQDLRPEVRREVVEILTQSLGTTFDLYSQIKQAHWNVKGPDFIQLHEFFDKIAGTVYEYIDLVAERITTLGGVAYGTIRCASEHSILSEYPLDAVHGREHLTALADRIATYAKHVRESIQQTTDLGDADTADIYTEISRSIDMYLWFVESHLA